jgi:hypothetical protein
MGFFSGRITCARFRVSGRTPRSFGPEQLEALEGHAIGKQKTMSADGAQVGWIAADHILDTRFDLAKNIVNDALHFALRIDTHAIPSDLLRAYTQVELEGLAAANPSGLPSSRQKREARMIAKERLENEAKDGRFLKRKAVPLLWDALSNELLVGTTSITAIDRLTTIFHQTFNRRLEPLTAGRQAFLQAETRGQSRGVDDARPTVFVHGMGGELAWLPDEDNRDFLGNEFLLWLWYTLEKEGDDIALSDQSQTTLMLARTLVLECPRGQTGRESISSDGPTRLPEAHRAIQAGKLPRKVGLTLVRHDDTYELTLQAETLAISGARLPAPEGTEEHARQEERVTQIRHLLETLDLLYNAFGEVRFGDGWTKELAKIHKWLKENPV